MKPANTPDIMPQSMAARLTNLKRQDIGRWLRVGLINAHITHGEKWVSLAEVSKTKANPPKKGRPRKIN